MNILATILIIISDILFVISMFTNQKKILLFLLICSNIFFASQYLCYPDGITGGICALINTSFLIGNYYIEKNNTDNYKIYFNIFAMICNIAIAIITWVGEISLLPMFANLLYFSGIMQNKIYFSKLFLFICNTLNAIYMFILTQYVGGALEILIAISSLVGAVYSYIKLKNQKIWFLIKDK